MITPIPPPTTATRASRRRVPSAIAAKPTATAAPVNDPRSWWPRNETSRCPGRGPSGSSTIPRNISPPQSPAAAAQTTNTHEEAVEVDLPPEEQHHRGREQRVLGVLRDGRQMGREIAERPPEARGEHERDEEARRRPRAPCRAGAAPSRTSPRPRRRRPAPPRSPRPTRTRRPRRGRHAPGSGRAGRREESRRRQRAAVRRERPGGRSRSATILACPCAPVSSGAARRPRSGCTLRPASGSWRRSSRRASSASTRTPGSPPSSRPRRSSSSSST